MKCSEISSLLVDSLYEEMPAEQRREFLAHVDGCASCSAEVKAMSSTLGHARAALRGPLAEDPPARVRARVLEAARAAVNAKAAERLKPRTSRAPQAEGFFARLWKTPWLVPALGAAGVATAVFLVKVIKNPQVIPEPKPAVTEAFTPPTAEPKESRQARPQPEAEGAPTATAPAEQGLAGLTKKPTAGMERESQAESKRASTADKLRTAPPTRSSPATSRRQFSNDLLAGVQWEAQPRTPVGVATASKGGGKASTPSRAAADAIAKPLSAPALRADKDEASLDEPLRPLPQGRKHQSPKAQVRQVAGLSHHRPALRKRLWPRHPRRSLLRKRPPLPSQRRLRRRPLSRTLRTEPATLSRKSRLAPQRQPRPWRRFARLPPALPRKRRRPQTRKKSMQARRPSLSRSVSARLRSSLLKRSGPRLPPPSAPSLPRLPPTRLPRPGGNAWLRRSRHKNGTAP